MKIAVIGTGYVGLVTATCLAESGNDVVGIDKDEKKIATLHENRLPIYEPGLLELVQRNRREGRLRFTTDLGPAVREARLVFIAVGTPQSKEGDADLSAVWAVARAIAQCAKELPPGGPGSKIVITKSTVPVGTNRRVGELLAEGGCPWVDVASNPEFLKEGAAIDDFMKPDRVVVGVRHPEVAEVLKELYAPFLRTERPFLTMTPESAEMTKYAANAMLATKISFINEMANLCDRLGADINDVRRGIGHDARIGFQFLFPGPGYGGSCFRGEETIYLPEGGQLRTRTLMEVFDRCLKQVPALVAGGRLTVSPDAILEPEGLQVLSFDLECRSTELTPVRAMTRRWYRGPMVTIQTSMTRTLEVTADHPVIVWDQHGYRIRLANEVEVGDRIAVTTDLPRSDAPGSLDLIELLAGSDLEADVHVSPIDDSFTRLYPQYAKQIPREVLKYPIEVRDGNRMPLRLFRFLRENGWLNVSTDELLLYTAKGAATKVHASIEIDADLARLCGYYLAEGFLSRDIGRKGAVRDRVGFSFHENEREYIDDVQRVLTRYGLKFFERTATHSTTTVVSSRVFAWFIRDVLGCGTRSEDKRLPSFAFALSDELKHELIRGAFSGDGSVTPVMGGKNFMLEYATVSEPFVNGLVLLLQSLGIVSSIRTRWMNKSKRPAYILRVSGVRQLEVLKNVFGEKHRERIERLLNGYQSSIKQRGFQRQDDLTLLTVRSVRSEIVERPVYSLETETGTVVVGSGLIVHNCFPKDIRAIIGMGNQTGTALHLMESVDAVNEAQKQVLFQKIDRHFGSELTGKTLAVWGLAFKPRTDDIREAPALTLIDALLERGVKLRVHDPEAMANVREIYGDRLAYCDRPYGAVDGADGLVIVTEWPEFRNPDFEIIRRLLSKPVIFDGRNIYELKQMESLGFAYYGIGRGGK